MRSNQGGLTEQLIPAAGKLIGQAVQAAGQSLFDPSGKFKLVRDGAFAAVEVGVTHEEGFKATTGSMVSMTNNVELVISIDGGVGQACCRCCCGGGSLFLCHYTLKGGTRGDVLIAPAVPGEVIMLELDDSKTWSLAQHSYLCSDSTVMVGAVMQSLAQGCCSGQGLFVMQASGIGRILVSSYGSIMRYELQAGEERKIDNGYLVAWDIKDYQIVKAGKTLAGSVFSGEGFAMKFVGPGTLYLQTRSIKALADTLAPFLPGKGGGGGDGGGSDN